MQQGTKAPKTFKEIVQAELNDIASPEERMSLYASKDSLHLWLHFLNDMIQRSEEEMNNQRVNINIQIDRIRHQTASPTGQRKAVNDPHFINRENGRIQQLQDTLRSLENKMKEYWSKIEARQVHIQEKLLFQAEQDQQLLDEYLLQEERVLLHSIERQEQFRIAALLNSKKSMARGVLVGAAYIHRLIEKGFSVTKAYAKIQEYVNGPLRSWQEDPTMPFPLLEDFLEQDEGDDEIDDHYYDDSEQELYAGPGGRNIMSLEDTYVD